jgi:hypothetical protein
MLPKLLLIASNAKSEQEQVERARACLQLSTWRVGTPR